MEIRIKNKKCIFSPEESWPVTSEGSPAFRSSGITICCSDLTGRYRICPSWLTAISRWEMKTPLDYKPNSSVLYITNIHLTCCSCRKVPSCSYWMIWPSGIWGTKQQSDLHGSTSNLSCDMTSWGKTDLYVAAIRHYNILMRGQVGHSFLWNYVLDLTLQKRHYRRSKKTHVYFWCCFPGMGIQKETWATKWLIPQLPGCLPSSGAELSVHLWWLFAGCMHFPPVIGTCW